MPREVPFNRQEIRSQDQLFFEWEEISAYSPKFSNWMFGDFLLTYNLQVNAQKVILQILSRRDIFPSSKATAKHPLH